jgi:hypothetical protein
MNLNAILGIAITKGAAKVARKPIAALRADVGELKRQVAELKRLLRAVQKVARQCAAPAPAPEAEDGNVPGIRPTGPMVRKVRARLGLTQAEFAKLAGVSSLTISKWEGAAGRIMLRNRTLAAFAAVREMGKREARQALAGM